MIINIISIFCIILLSACSVNQHLMYQINNDEKYLKTPVLHKLNLPFGITLPIKNNDYTIPLIVNNGKFGKTLNISPPVQPLTFLNNQRLEYIGNSVSMKLISEKYYNIWFQIISVIQKKGYVITDKQDFQKNSKINWIQLTHVDSKQYNGRYQIKLLNQKHHTVITVISLDLNKKERLVNNQSIIQFYASKILQDIIKELK